MLAVRVSRGALLIGLLALVPLGVARPVRAETRAFAFPPALRPGTLNTVATSKTAPVAFVGSRDTDTVFAFDPRSGALVGSLEVGDGPMAITLFEDGARRRLGVTCDGFYGDSPNAIALVDATQPTAMRLERTIEIPDGLVFLLGYRTLTFVEGGAKLLVTATSPETGRAILFAFDVATGAELGRVDVGFVPGSLALREVGGRRVVALTQSVAPRGRVTVVDATDLAALRVERIIRFPRKSGFFNVNNVVLDADATHGFVATGQANELFSFEVETGRVLSKTIVGSFPTTVTSVDLDGAPRLLVTNEGSATLAIYDVADPSNPVLSGIFLAPSAFLDVEPSVSSDGRTAFVGSTDQNRLFAVDVATGDLRYRVPTGQRPVSSAVWEGAGELYACVAASTGANVTTVRDGSLGGTVQTFSGPNGGVFFTLYQNVVLADDGRVAFLASKLTNELFAFDVASGSLLGRVGVSSKPSQIAVGVDASGRRRVAVLGSGDSVLTVVDATDPSALSVTGAVSIESPAPFYLEYANVIVASDGTTAFVADGNQFVYSIDLASASIVGTTGTGFVPVTLALREDRGQRRLAVLNAQGGSSSVAVLDATNSAAMTRIAATPLPDGIVVALNNVPRFSVDGRFILVGASLSERFFTIDAASGRIAGSVGSSAVVASPFADDVTQRFAAVELGTDDGALFRLKTSGAPRRAVPFTAGGDGFFLVGNDPVLAPDGGSVLVANYGRRSLLAFDRSSGALAGELPLGVGPGPLAVGGGSVVALEVNGSASRVLFGNLGDLAAPAPMRAVARAHKDGRATGAIDPASLAAPDGPRAASAFDVSRRRLLEWAPRSKRK